MSHRTRTNIAVGASILFIAIMAVLLISVPLKPSAPKTLAASSLNTQQRIVYTPQQLSARVPLSAASHLFVQALSVQSSENISGQEVGRGTTSRKPTPEEDSVSQETQEILGGKERNA